MEKLASLNAAGVAATVLLAAVAMLLAAMAAVNGQAQPISMLPQWDMLGHTRGEQLEALTDVIPVILACYVAHQSLHPLMPLLKPYSQQRMLKVSSGLSNQHSRHQLDIPCWGHASQYQFAEHISKTLVMACGTGPVAQALNNVQFELCWRCSANRHVHGASRIAGVTKLACACCF